jgi:hypothetical protein
MKPSTHTELPVIQHTYDFIIWYVPILNRLPKDHRFTLGERLITGLYDLLEQLIAARYTPKVEKPALLPSLNHRLDLLRYQTRLLYDFQLINSQRYEHAGRFLHTLGTAIGAWLRHSKKGTGDGS